MSPVRAESTLRKVTLNLYDEDVDYLEMHQDQWTVWIRQLIHAEVRKAKITNTIRYPLVRRLGDLE